MTLSNTCSCLKQLHCYDYSNFKYQIIQDKRLRHGAVTRPWWCLHRSCCQGLCLGPWSCCIWDVVAGKLILPSQGRILRKEGSSPQHRSAPYLASTLESALKTQEQQSKPRRPLSAMWYAIAMMRERRPSASAPCYLWQVRELASGSQE